MLRVVASRGRRGMRVGEIVATSGLPEATCFRMLRRLEIEGLVEREPHTKKYFLGPLLHELGLLARLRYRLSELCDGALHRLADVTQDTVYLSERSGLEAVCTNRALGDYPIKSLALDIGIRRPLGVGSGGLAILCALPPADAEAIVLANAHRYEKFASFTADFLRGAVAEGRARLLLSRWCCYARHSVDGCCLSTEQSSGRNQCGGDFWAAGSCTPRGYCAAHAPGGAKDSSDNGDFGVRRGECGCARSSRSVKLRR
ncbi:helix-turn-helix domain-containing protein [Polaromonas sp. P1-6]|nr:helix-turn-helix domain-containing protein [Polaromonas sp. P1-6]